MKSYVFPGEIEEEIRSINAREIPYMRTAGFSRIVKDCERMLLELIHCRNGRVIPYTASGTAAMDAVVTNYVKALGGKAFVIVGGSFGNRWKQLCDYYNVENEVFSVAFAKDIDYEALEAAVMAARPKVLLCQQHETSTGALYDVKRISEICRRHGVSPVVDVISSFLADPLYMDEWGIDICLTSTQKGLNVSPGLSIVFLSPRLDGFRFAHESYYFDFEENLKNLTRGQTPYSPATTIFLQMHERLKRDVEIGVDNIISQVRSRALYFRGLCKENGWEMPVECPSNCITGFFVRKNGDRLFTEMINRGFYIMPGGTPCYFRVSHLGLQTEADLDDLAVNIKEVENTEF